MHCKHVVLLRVCVFTAARASTRFQRAILSSERRIYVRAYIARGRARAHTLSHVQPLFPDRPMSEPLSLCYEVLSLVTPTSKRYAGNKSVTQRLNTLGGERALTPRDSVLNEETESCTVEHY